MLIETKMLNP